jgi:hypothetical protein
MGCCGSPPTYMRTLSTSSRASMPAWARMFTIPGASPQSGITDSRRASARSWRPRLPLHDLRVAAEVAVVRAALHGELRHLVVEEVRKRAQDGVHSGHGVAHRPRCRARRAASGRASSRRGGGAVGGLGHDEVRHRHPLHRWADARDRMRPPSPAPLRPRPALSCDLLAHPTGRIGQPNRSDCPSSGRRPRRLCPHHSDRPIRRRPRRLRPPGRPPRVARAAAPWAPALHRNRAAGHARDQPDRRHQHHLVLSRTSIAPTDRLRVLAAPGPRSSRARRASAAGTRSPVCASPSRPP